MSFLKKFGKAVNPLDKDTYKNSLNPVKKHIEGYKEGGWEGAVDPYQTMGKNVPDTPEESAAYVAKARKKASDRKATGMKKGGKTRACCRGMGKATQGGGYGK
jgi:hypothetical protein